jgi:DNA replication protein DnaC
MNDLVNRKEKTDICEKHGEYTVQTVSIPFFGGTKEFVTICPVCAKEENYNEEMREREREKRLIDQKWHLMNIDKKYFESTLDNFDVCNDELKKHLEVCRRFSEKPEGKLVMLGEHGNGKTHLAIGILKKLGGVIFTAYEIGLMIRQSYGQGGKSEWEIFNELCSVPLLVIDEVEKLKDSEAKNHWMSHVIGKRYNRALPIILIANCHVQSDCKKPAKPCPKCLEYHLENDVLSRIIEDGIVMKFNSEDYREKIRKSRGL